MRYLKLFLNYEQVFANEESSANVLELIKSLQYNGFFNENGLIQYEDERENELNSIFEKYYSTIKAERNEDNQI